MLLKVVLGTLLHAQSIKGLQRIKSAKRNLSHLDPRLVPFCFFGTVIYAIIFRDDDEGGLDSTLWIWCHQIQGREWKQ